MFQAVTHVPLMLPASAYFEDSQLRRERETVLGPGWNFLGLRREVPADGDFVTRDVAGQPLILWNRDNRLHCFLNVCAHRFSMLTCQPAGSCERLTCQYHGWEYDCSGQTRKIPDAVSFKPLHSGQLGLVRWETATSGDAIFVHPVAPTDSNAQMQPRSLADHLGPVNAILNDAFNGSTELVARMNWEVDANWKLVAENAIESYHVEFVHKSSFGSMPTAESCEHELADRFTRFTTYADSQAPWPIRFMERVIHRALRLPYVERYDHYHVYPNQLFTFNKMYGSLLVVEPRSATRAHLQLSLFTRGDLSASPFARAALLIANRFARRQVRSVIAEDLRVLADVQRGLQVSPLPNGGLLSVREERIAHFQNYIANTTHRP